MSHSARTAKPISCLLIAQGLSRPYPPSVRVPSEPIVTLPAAVQPSCGPRTQLGCRSAQRRDPLRLSDPLDVREQSP